MRQGAAILHIVSSASPFKPGMKVLAKVDAVRRSYIRPHHTGTHLLTTHTSAGFSSGGPRAAIRLGRLHDDREITDQIRIYARRGFFHGTTVEKSHIDLPWPKFENITRLLGGER